ncbi:MAG: chemotaxis protein CheA, partial [Bdellovibrionales bacterium]|nr:chemotaxis protein CheA [Bdellovibrionales bacterium]
MALKTDIPQEALQEFVAECEEITQRVFNNLSKVEKNEFDKSTIDELYRDMHTMKGSSMLYGFVDIGELSHAMETCLDPLRKESLSISSSLIESLYKCLSLIDNWIQFIKGSDEYTQENLIEKKYIALPELISVAAELFGGNIAVHNDSLYPEVQENKSDVDKNTNPDKKLASTPLKQEVKQVVKKENIVEKQPVQKEKTEVKVVKPDMSKNIEKEAKEANAPDNSSQDKNKQLETIRVNVELLDRMMNLVGELVLVRNQVLQYTKNSEDLEVVNLGQSLDIVTSDLQSEIMKTRMQPIGTVLNKYQRLVRDIAAELGKKIELKLIGSETELDKTLLEAIKDPLLHAVRNACDHGIEAPSDRASKGKSETGNIQVNAFHEGGQVVIEITDDGKGLDKEKILNSAIQKGLISAEKAALLSEREAFNLIMEAGFSTADKISSVSGRGVGMDVVRTNIEQIGGTVELNSVFHEGTTIRLKIPLTLAIVPAMIIRNGNNNFAIPQVKLVELVRVDPEDSSSQQIEILQGKPVFRLRGDLLPLVNLEEILNNQENNSSSNELQKAVNIVVLSSDDQLFGLIV